MGRETARRMCRVGDLKGIAHFEAKFYIEASRFAPISIDR